MIKHVLERDAEERAAGRRPLLDDAFIAEHTDGFAAFRAEASRPCAGTNSKHSPACPNRASATPAAPARRARDRLLGMGITQHRDARWRPSRCWSTSCCCAAMSAGPGRHLPGARAQQRRGDRTMGIYEQPAPAFLDRPRDVFGFEPPGRRGRDRRDRGDARRPRQGVLRDGRQLRRRHSRHRGDPGRVAQCEPHRARGDQAQPQPPGARPGTLILILPCLGRTEIDLQAGGPQSVSVEDSMSMVHASGGINAPASKELLSEPAIVARLAQATLGKRSDTPWTWLVETTTASATRSRGVFEEFADFNARVHVPGGFHLSNSAGRRRMADRDRQGALHGARHRRRGRSAARSPEQRVHGPPPCVRTTSTTPRCTASTTATAACTTKPQGGVRELPTDIAELGLNARATGSTSKACTTTACAASSTASCRPATTSRGCIGAYLPETNPLVPLDSYAERARRPARRSRWCCTCTIPRRPRRRRDIPAAVVG